MNDDTLNAGFLALMVGIAIAAVASLEGTGRHHKAAPAAEMPVVKLPAVLVAGKRQAPYQVVQLPLVTVSGRRVPTMEAVTLARAQ